MGNLGGVTSIAGDYALQLLANGSGIVGAGTGRALAADAIETFRVTSTNLAGTPNADQYYIRVNGENLEIFGTVPPGALPAYTMPVDMLTGLTLSGGDGDDVLHIAGVLPLAPVINLGAGRDRLILDGGSRMLGGELGGSWSVEDLEVRGTAEVSFVASEVLESLSISGEGAVQIAMSGGRAVSAGQLLIADGGLLDIHDNGLIVRGMSAAEVAGMVGDGRVVSSLAGDGSFKGIAVVSNDIGGGVAMLTTFCGTAVSATDVLVKCTWTGDGNLDGLINADDYFLIDSGYVTQSGGYANGDFNYDGLVNADDYFMIDSAFIGQGAPLAGEGPTGLSGDAIVISRSSKQTKEERILAELFSTEPVM